MRDRSRAVQLVLAMLACLSRAASAAPPAAPTARATMEQWIGNVLAILHDGSLPVDGKRQKVKKIGEGIFNFEVMGRLSLGRFYRNLTAAQKTAYQQEFKQHLVNVYDHTTDMYTNEQVQLLADHAEPDGDCTLQTRIMATRDGIPNQKVAAVDYRLRRQNDGWLIIDFSINGASVVANFRAQFQEIISASGIDELLKDLHDKNAATQP